MKYLVTDNGVKFVDDDDQPITLDAALETVRRVAAYVEAIGRESEPNPDTKTRVDSAPAA